jgi:drug/metabolite transporter (DMT)-like permease
MSIGAAIFVSIMILIFRQINALEVSPVAMITILFIMVSGMFGIQSYVTNTNLNIGSKVLWLILIASIASYIANYLTVTAISQSPNPGYVMAVSSLSTAIIAVASYYFFGDDIGYKEIVGIVLMTMGLFLIVL